MSFSAVLRAARDIPRADPADIEAFGAAPVGNVVDAIGRTGAMDHAVKALTPAKRFSGSALTVEAGPRDNLAPWAALRLARPGDVLVISTGGHVGHSVAGDLLMGMAANAGIVAIVTDGAIRDLTGAGKTGIPVFAAAVSPNSPQKNGPGSVGLPIVCGGVTVRAGDVVCGDEDGVVVVPGSRIRGALLELEKVRAKETVLEKAVGNGATAPAWIADVALHDLFTYEE